MRTKSIGRAFAFLLSAYFVFGQCLYSYAGSLQKEGHSTWEIGEKNAYFSYIEDFPLTINMPEPITAVETEKGKARFKYDLNNNLMKKTSDNGVVYYSEAKGKILSSGSSKYSYKLLYSWEDGEERCTGILLNNKLYSFEYEDGNVSLIKLGEIPVCRYDYSHNVLIPTIEQLSKESLEVGHINPIRYQGMFYDEELELYYMGEGIFYDPNSQVYIQNKFSVSYKGYTGKSAVIMATTSDIIENSYEDLWNDPTYGSRTLSPGTDKKKWYAPLSKLEVVARCIYAENTHKDRSKDRIAETVAIMNRMVRDKKTAYSVVTAAGQFSTICKNNPGPNSLNLKKKNDPVWREATLLACIAYYGKDRDDIPYFFSIPAGINTQYNFRGLSSVTISYDSPGNIKIAGKVRKNVVVTGYGIIESAYDVEEVKKLSGYNIFFNDLND